MRTVDCAYCGKQFETLHYKKMTCSEDCRYFRTLESNCKRYREMLTRERACKICGVVFSATDSRKILCSDSCADINQRNHFLAHTAKKKKPSKNTIKQCKYCSAKIRNNPKRKFCSDHCSYLSRLTSDSATLLERQGSVEEQRNCKRCNAAFIWTGKRNQKTHCSDSCAYETKKQLAKEYAAKKRRERTVEQHEAFLAAKRIYSAKYRARIKAIAMTDYINC